MDYHTIVSLLIPDDIKVFIAPFDILDQKVLRLSSSGYTIYLISEVYFWVHLDILKGPPQRQSEAVNTE
jgi:hypothetical protein